MVMVHHKGDGEAKTSPPPDLQKPQVAETFITTARGHTWRAGAYTFALSLARRAYIQLPLELAVLANVDDVPNTLTRARTTTT